jgi:hypothetical protein
MLRKLLITGALLVALLTGQAGTALAQVTQLNATIKSVTLIDPAHALVEGTLSCDPPQIVRMLVTLRQRGGLFGFRQAAAVVFVSCAPTPTAFSVVVVGGGPLHRGPALLELEVSLLGQPAQTIIFPKVMIR